MMFSALILVASQLLLSTQVNGEVAPAGHPVQFQQAPNGKCLMAPTTSNGESVIISDCTTLPTFRSWTVTKGGVASGQGPPTSIQIFGNKCLDVRDGVDKPGTKLQIWDCDATNPNQLFNVNGDLTISWAGHNKCVDLTNGLTASGNVLQIWDCVGNTNQRWVANELTNVPGPGAPAGIPLQITINEPSPSIKAPCLTATSNRDGAPVVIQSCAVGDSASHAWTIDAGGASYGTGPPTKIRIFGDKCLDVTNGLDASGNKLQIWTCGSGLSNGNQVWHVNSDLTILWAGHNGCVDLSSGVQNDGNPIQIWACGINGNVNSNQKWNWAIII